MTAKILHWGFIGVFLYALTKQLDNVEQLEEYSLLQFEMVFASVFLVLLIARFIYMHLTRPSALPENTSQIIKRFARGAHLTMYASLSMIAISGLMIGALYGYGIKSGLTMNIVIGLHELSVTTSYLVIGLHIGAAIFHRLTRDGIWSSMVPIWKEDLE